MQITNKSSHPIKVTHIAGQRTDSSKRGFVVARPYPRNLPVPIEIPPRDNRTIWFKKGDYSEVRMRYQVVTADGQTFRTKPIVLDEQPAFGFVTPGGD